MIYDLYTNTRPALKDSRLANTDKACGSDYNLFR